MISDGDNNFMQNKCDKCKDEGSITTALPKTKNANIRPSEKYLHGVDLTAMQFQNWLLKHIFITNKIIWGYMQLKHKSVYLLF